MDELWPGGLLYTGDSIGGDSLALAAFAASHPGHRGCDLGCGSGILLLLLAREDPGLQINGVDIRQSAVESCTANIEANGLSARCSVQLADLRSAPFPAGSMDFVITNPPYFALGSGAASPDAERAAMRTESATVQELCAAASALLRRHGSFYFVHRAERLPEIFAALQRASLEPKRLRFMAGSANAVPALFLCEAKKGAAPGLALEPVLFQRRPDGQEAEEYRKITHWED